MIHATPVPALTRGLVLTALLLVGRAGPVAAQCGERFDWSVSPGLFDAESGTRFGARGSVDSCFVGHDLSISFSKSYYVEMDGRALWVWDDARVPGEIAFTARAGGSISLRKLNAPDPTAPPGQARAIAFDYGFLGLGLHGQYEASPDREEQAIAGGAQLRWVRVGWWLAPSVVAAFDFVKPTSSETRDAFDLTDDAFERFTLRGYWLIPVRRFELEIDAAYFEAFGLSDGLEALGWESGRYLQAIVGFAADWRLSNRFVLERISLGYADGQLPSTPNDRKAWTVGLQFGG